MRKQELIHLHDLLAEVQRYLGEEDVRAIDLAEYESLGTVPTSFHRNKGAHQAAVFTLAEAITDDLPAEVPAAAPAAAD